MHARGRKWKHLLLEKGSWNADVFAALSGLVGTARDHHRSRNIGGGGLSFYNENPAKKDGFMSKSEATGKS